LVVRQYHLEKKKKKKRQTRDGHEWAREGKEKGGKSVKVSISNLDKNGKIEQ
jgi:hypothetical protein